jgi:hypothetical protein
MQSTEGKAVTLRLEIVYWLGIKLRKKIGHFFDQSAFDQSVAFPQMTPEALHFSSKVARFFFVDPSIHFMHDFRVTRP